jgi:hypothetical protein
VTAAITPTAHSGSRDQAQALLASVPERLEGQRIVLDCRDLQIATPSFLDEIVKLVLVDRGAAGLDVVNATDRVKTLLTRSSDNRDVAQRLHVALRIP